MSNDSLSRSRYDVCVVGAGVTGLATARWLARLGKSVVVFEQYQIGHSRGSSTGPARAFAIPHNQTHLIELALETLPLWRELEAESGRRLLWEHGAMLRSRSPDRVTGALTLAGADYEVLSTDEVYKRYGVALPGELPCIWTAAGGALEADTVLGALRDSAVSLGVDIQEDSPVESISQNGGSVEIKVAGDSVRVGRAVLTGGPWSPRLLDQAQIPVPVGASRQTVVYVPMPDARRVPALFEEGQPSVYWVTSADDELRVGAHVDGLPGADPDDNGRPDQGVVSLIEQHLVRRFPDHHVEIRRADTCFYTETRNEEFVLERHGQVVVGIACNGRGFKFAPLIGKKLAALAAED